VNSKDMFAFDDSAAFYGKKRVAHVSSSGLVKTHCFMLFVSLLILRLIMTQYLYAGLL